MRRRANFLSIGLLTAVLSSAVLSGCGTADFASEAGHGLDAGLPYSLAYPPDKTTLVEAPPADLKAADADSKALGQLAKLEDEIVGAASGPQRSSTVVRSALYTRNEALAAKLPKRMGRREVKVGIFGFDEVHLGRSEFFKKWNGALHRHMENQVTHSLLCAKGVISLCGSTVASHFDSSLFSLRQADKHLPEVNHHVNKVSYVEDAANYKQQDYWAAPREFFGKGGDCEDYAIAKYLLLRELGIDPNSMRIVVVMDEQRDAAHAVLAVYLPDDILVLDNLSRSVERHQYVSNYVPIYSVNEKNAWLHTRHKAH